MNTRGALAERDAANYLRKKGYKLLDFNFKSYGGEIDLIMLHKKTIVFIEVKARSENSWGDPGEYVDYFKRQKIIKTAHYYLSRNKSELPWRYDIVEVTLGEYRAKKINHIINAFGED
jgi:putative endonuclease